MIPFKKILPAIAKLSNDELTQLEVTVNRFLASPIFPYLEKTIGELSILHAAIVIRLQKQIITTPKKGK